MGNNSSKKFKMKQVTAIVIGAGQRGKNYATYGLDFPDQFKIVGIAEPREFYRKQLQGQHSLPDENVHTTWEELIAKEKFADCALICTPDRHHKGPAVAFAKKGYHILLEKPMAVTYEDCKEIVDTCKENDVLLTVCHVLRYTPEARKIKDIIDSGDIGDVVNIQLLEPVGFWHFAHSYVRGNWRNSDSSSFSLLAKSCHDIDLIEYWMGERKCKAISSFGSLNHFKKENKPAGASSRCLECKVEKQCPYSAKRIYLDRVKMGNRHWPVSVITEVPDIESVTEALKTGPYGRCVYDCDNNVVDNQVVNFQYDSGQTVQFTMVAFTEKLCARQVKVFGTKGELTCSFGQMKIRHFDFLQQCGRTIDLVEEMEAAKGSRLMGHGGADFFAMEAFVHAIATGDRSKVLTGPEETLKSHHLCFMAEQSRLENRVINL